MVDEIYFTLDLPVPSQVTTALLLYHMSRVLGELLAQYALPVTSTFQSTALPLSHFYHSKYLEYIPFFGEASEPF